VAREVRVALYWNAAAGTVERRFGARDVANDSELEALLRGSRDDYLRAGEREVPLIVDGDPRVPWSTVLEVVNLGRRVGLSQVQFASSGN
jgi:biopolymer transport protein ExbD